MPRQLASRGVQPPERKPRETRKRSANNSQLGLFAFGFRTPSVIPLFFSQSAVNSRPMPDNPYVSASKKCDIVMKGGITSGVVYPRAVTRLAREYRFQSIGGTS